jgi:hypothetical protein
MWVCAVVACIAAVLSAGACQKEARLASRPSTNTEECGLQAQEIALVKMT